MMTIILIVCLGILIVNMYFFKAVCRSNDAINTSIDQLIKRIEYFNANIKILANIQRDIDVKVNNINSKMIDSITNVTESKIEILNAINQVKKQVEHIDFTTGVVLNAQTGIGSNINNISNKITDLINVNIRNIETTVDLINAKSNKFNTTFSKDITEAIKWREHVAQNLTEIYGEAVETKKAVISLKSKPQAKSKKASSKENEVSK